MKKYLLLLNDDDDDRMKNDYDSLLISCFILIKRTS